MSLTTVQTTPPSRETEADITIESLYRLSVEQYHAIARAGIPVYWIVT